MAEFDGKRVLITGASRGLGKHLALDFARFGARIVVNYGRSEAPANAVVSQITDAGREAIATSSTPVGNIRLIVCASPAYLRANGTPTAPEEIARHPCITFSRKGTPYPWPFRMPSGQVREINVRPRLLVNSAQSAVQAALEGVGLTQLYSYQAARPVASGELIIVLRAFEPDPVPVTINAIGQSPMPLKVKAFAEFARLKLSERLAAIQSIGEI